MKRKLGKIEPVQKIWLSAAEAKAYLDCSDEFIKKLRDKALVKFSWFEHKYYYELASINRLIERNRVI